MEDQDSPTCRFGFGSIEPGLVSETPVSTDITANEVISPEKAQGDEYPVGWSLREIPPHDSGRGRGNWRVRFRPIRGQTRLSKEQLATVAAAKAAMTPHEQAHIAQRQSSDATSRGERLSRAKEKSFDHLNFGGIELEPGEEDLEVQLAMLEAYRDAADKRIADAKKRMQAATDRGESARGNSVPSRVPGERVFSAPGH
jgi:hypothetical protein